MSDSDTSPKENILKIMDDFLSHLNRTKKLFMVLIFASFIIAPLSLALAVFVLTPQFAMQVGQPYDVSVSFVGVPSQGPEFGFSSGIEILNESDVIVSNFTEFGSMHGPPGAMQYGHGDVFVLRGDVPYQKGDWIHEKGNETAIILRKPSVKLQYVPSDMDVEPFFVAPVPPHRFMYISNQEQFGKQTDVTTLVIVVVAVSAALATTWLVLGVKEYKFFSKWNSRYSNYKKLQDDLDKELED